MSNGKGPAKALMDDKKVHKDLRNAAESLREALRPASRQAREGPAGGTLLLIGSWARCWRSSLSEDLRKAVLDRLFGAEEEFEYTSTTTPAPESRHEELSR